MLIFGVMIFALGVIGPNPLMAMFGATLMTFGIFIVLVY